MFFFRTESDVRETPKEARERIEWAEREAALSAWELFVHITRTRFRPRSKAREETLRLLRNCIDAIEGDTAETMERVK